MVKKFEDFISENNFEKGQQLRKKKAAQLKSIAVNPKSRVSVQKKEVKTQTDLRKAATE